MGLKKIIVGEPMPDKNDPKYKDRYEREVEAGRKFASASGISWAAKRVQEWGQSHKVSFLAIVFGFVIICFFVNVFRMVNVYHQSSSHKATAVERVDSALNNRFHPHE